MLRGVLVLALFAGSALALTPALPWVDVAGAMRAALDGDPLVNRTSVVSNSKGGVTVRIDMLPCPAGAGAACRTNRGRRAGALATLLYLAEQGRSDEGPFRVRAEVRLNGGIALRGRAPSTAADAVDLLKGALAGNQYFSRVWDRTVPPVIPGLDWINIVFKPKVVQYPSTGYLEVDGLATVTAAQVAASRRAIAGKAGMR